MFADARHPPSCLITGGSRGIGDATVRLFADQGFRIATCGRDPQRLHALESALSAQDAVHFVRAVDLSDVRQACEFGQAVIAHFGRIDVLVNNAAAAPLALLDDIDESTFEQTIDVNIRSVFYLTQCVWRQMKRQGRGVIVNISSLAAIDPFPGFSIYGASKAWLDLMTKALGAEGEAFGIRVYSIRAGAVETPLLRGLFPDFPADQCVSPDEVAASVWDVVRDVVRDGEKHRSGSLIEVTRQT